MFFLWPLLFSSSASAFASVPLPILRPSHNIALPLFCPYFDLLVRDVVVLVLVLVRIVVAHRVYSPIALPRLLVHLSCTYFVEQCLLASLVVIVAFALCELLSHVFDIFLWHYLKQARLNRLIAHLVKSIFFHNLLAHVLPVGQGLVQVSGLRGLRWRQRRRLQADEPVGIPISSL